MTYEDEGAMSGRLIGGILTGGGDLTSRLPELQFHFTPSEGEPFTMTRTEVADLVVFMRKLKVAEDRWYKCPGCGGAPEAVAPMSDLPQLRCIECACTWLP